MSKKQLENLFTKAESDKGLQRQIADCGVNNSCIVALGRKHGHKFSPATVSHWQREHA
ncbi:Nif11-like leader peptide family natural product precursor [Prochlorococcus sp. MIT 1341]|uniref:Nif11-like leader peptide family natural product precursor n=1 Tax=Prochlorococcus sp. MIT 1341 TaxID=3096221 RepID=UPI002A7550E7|nr:Nif11-like leader peptide family natural product precursor [Prochlorococcus sp. MIT 1341]